MPGLSEEQKRRIVQALEEKGASPPCPRWGNPKFTLLDGYVSEALQSELGSLVIGGASVPAVVVACTRCGFVSEHALGALGLLPTQEKEP